LLEKATALDWGDDFEGSATIAEQARAVYSQHQIRDLEPEVALAEARVVYRKGRFVEAAPLLEQVVTKARALGHQETEIVGMVIWGPALVESKQLDNAERVFDELIAKCREVGDQFHLGAAHANRTWLWTDRGEVDRVASDLQAVIQIAREIGQAVLERTATHNLSEAMLWAGAFDLALQLANRSAALQSAHGEGAEQLDQLLLARIHAARQDHRQLAQVVGSLVTSQMTATELAIVGVLRCIVERAGPDRWAEALASTESLSIDLRMEMAHLAKQADRLPEAVAARLVPLEKAHPIWSRRPPL
jgi:eukaryotic-like serine/threonine-protein kinase